PRPAEAAVHPLLGHQLHPPRRSGDRRRLRGARRRPPAGQGRPQVEGGHVTRLVAGLAAAALLLTACSTAEDEGAGGTAGFVGGDGSVTIIAPEERSAAPVLEGETLDGETLSTADLAGQPLIINVWGSWCAPCRAEAPELVKSAAEL